MVTFDTTNAAYMSNMSGFKDVETTQATGTIAGQSLTANQSTSVILTIDLPMSRANLLPVMRLNFAGLDAEVSNFWFPMQGVLAVRNQDIVIACYSKGISTGRQISFILSNQAAAGRTFPGSTVSVYAKLYDFPWNT